MKPEFKVGLMSFIAMVILLSMTFSVGKLNPFKKLGPKIPITFNYVGNLKTKANARISGVIIGVIDEIKLDNNKVLVIIQLNSSDIKIKRNCQIFISSEGLIGESYIDIKIVKDSAPFYEDGDPPLEGIDPVGVGEIMSDVKGLTRSLQQTLDIIVSENTKTNMDIIMTNMADITKNLNEVIRGNQILINDIVKNLDSIIVENKKNINQTASNFNGISLELKDMVKDNHSKINEIVSNLNSLSLSLDKKTLGITDELLQTAKTINSSSEENSKKVTNILSNLESLTNKLNKISENFSQLSDKMDKGSGTLSKLINDPLLYDNLNKTIEETHKIVPELRTTFTSLKEITEKINRGDGTVGQMITDKNLYQNVNELVSNANKVVTRVSDLRTFWGYQIDYRFPNPTVDKNGDTHTIKKDFKNTFIFKISVSPEKYYKLELNDIGEKDKVSVEVGQTFMKKLVIRAGVVESTGGIGANYYLFKDKLYTGFTAYNFNEKANNFNEKPKPGLRFTNELFLYENAYLTFGVDNILNQERYYVGMKYLLEDQDIKYLLGLVSYAK